MKDDDWVDAIEREKYATPETYQDFHKTVKVVTDDELDSILHHANEEYKRRNTQVEHWDTRNTQVKNIQTAEMYMDYSETEKEVLEEFLRCLGSIR